MKRDSQHPNHSYHCICNILIRNILKIFGFDPREIIFLVSLDDKYTKKQKSRGKKFLCFHKIFVPNMITAGWLHYCDGIGQHIKLMKIYPFTFSFPLTQLYRNFRFHFLDSEVTIYFIISTFTRPTQRQNIIYLYRQKASWS